MNTVTVAIAAFGITLGLGALAQVSADYQASSYDNAVCSVAPEYAGPDCGNPGDDNGDGWIEEDESGWNCRTMGNRICGEVTER